MFNHYVKSENKRLHLKIDSTKPISSDARRATIWLIVKSIQATFHTENEIAVDFKWSELGDVYIENSNNRFERFLLTASKVIRKRKVTNAIQEVNDLNLAVCNKLGETINHLTPLSRLTFKEDYIYAWLNKEFLRMVCLESVQDLPNKYIELENSYAVRLYEILVLKLYKSYGIPFLNENVSRLFVSLSELRSLLRMPHGCYTYYPFFKKIIIKPTLDKIEESGLTVEFQEARCGGDEIILRFTVYR